ncbi:MAG: glycosyltransferase family 39 protein [Candidatus Omnitrophica bacterium]|nr:glycosyltransferase family 39 protein [Candidatus Omnitrophota bacterium]
MIPTLEGHRGSGRRTTWLVIGLFVLACLLRLGAVQVALRGQYNPYHQLYGDMAAYVTLAVSLAHGEGYSNHYEPVLADVFRDPEHTRTLMPPRPTARKAIGYPLFLAILFRLFGYHLVPVLVVQAILSAVSALLIYAIGRRAGSPKAALIAYAIAVCYYPFWYKAITLLVETVLVFLLLCAIYGFVRWFERPSIWTACWTGLAVGASILVKPLLWPLLPAIFLAAYLVQRRRGLARAFLTSAPVLVVTTALVLAPWVLRNYRHTGRWEVSASFGGKHLRFLYSPLNMHNEIYAKPGFVNEFYPQEPITLPRTTPPVLAEYLQDDVYGRSAKQFLLSDPGFFFRAMPGTLWNTWRPDYPGAKWYRVWSNYILYVGLIPFFLLGVALAVKRRHLPALVLLGFIVALVGFHAVVASQIRYRITIMPFYFVLAASGLEAAWQRLRGRPALEGR